MNALQQYPEPDRSPAPARKPRVRTRSKQRSNPHQALTSEVAVKLTVNLIVAVVAAGSLLKLVPYNLAQETELKQLKAKVAKVNHRVESLQTDFDRHFDPQQALNVMQEQNIRFNPKQKQVVWLTPERQTAEASKLDETEQADSLLPEAD